MPRIVKTLYRDQTATRSLLRRSRSGSFWATLHGGRYEEIGGTLDRLKGAYLQHPNDPQAAAHIGFLHIWRVSESARLESAPPTVTDDVTLAHRYFDEAVTLNPSESRFRGFLGASMLLEGKIHGDEKLTRKGAFELKDAVNAWPEFNLFTRGYTMSRLPISDEHYSSALQDQWVNLGDCTGERVDRRTANYAPYMHLETRTGWKRACWNSWIAPHNFEGFFLNMGDMIVKAGDPVTARNVYAQAKLGKEYSKWPYRDVLERRIAQADDNVAVFRGSSKDQKERRMMVESPFSCMGCHQN